MLSNTPADHHSRMISHIMPKLIEMNLPALEKYFDRRLYQTGVCKNLSIGPIKIQNGKEYEAIASTLTNEKPEYISRAFFDPKFKE